MHDYKYLIHLLHTVKELTDIPEHLELASEAYYSERGYAESGGWSVGPVEVVFSSLERLSPLAARAIVDSGTSGDTLSFPALKELTENVAKELSFYGGRELQLDGLKSLTLETALSLAEHSNSELGISMLGLTGLSPQVVAALDSCVGLYYRVDSEYVGDVPRPEREAPSLAIINSIGMQLIPITAGTFLMGTPGMESGHFEKGYHEATIAKDFYLGMTPVTQNHYLQVMGKNPSFFQGGNVQNLESTEFPVEQVTWEDAMEFCEKLSSLPNEKNAGRAYRLPMEAEWEYACRAGTTTEFSFGNSSEELGDYAWYNHNSGGRTHPVGLKKPNPWGLYDMHGNVWEWCADRPNEAISPRTGPYEGAYRVRRGGCWGFSHESCKSAGRAAYYNPYMRSFLNGFRVALSFLENPKRPS